MDDSDKPLDAILWKLGRSWIKWELSLFRACFSIPVFDHCSYQVGQTGHYPRVTFVSFDDPQAVLCTSEEPLTLPASCEGAGQVF